MLNALDSFHGYALVIFQRKLVYEALDESPSLRGLLYVGSEDGDDRVDYLANDRVSREIARYVRVGQRSSLFLVRFGEIDFQEHPKSTRNERSICQTGGIDDAGQSIQGPEMDDGMGIVDERHKHVNCCFEQRTSSEATDMTVYRTKGQRAACSTVRIAVIDHLINKVFDLACEVVGSRETCQAANRFTSRRT